MNLTPRSIAGAIALLLASAVQLFAIEGLQISLQCSNVVLSWPSQEGETYMVQYRPDLTSTNSWTTLADYLPAAAGANVTVFVHSNIVQYPNCGGGSFAAVQAGGAQYSSTATPSAQPAGPMVMRADGTGGATPLALYPTGFDLSGYIIFNPATGQTVSGSSYSARLLPAGGTGIPSPQDSGGSGAGETNAPLETGFYQVVRDGVHLWGVTNGTTFSGVVTIPVEAANDSGTLVNLSLVEDGSPVSDASIDMPPILAPLQVVMDTTQMTNGVHEVFAHAVWQVSTGTNEGDAYLVEADSTPVTINVFNEISFPNWMPSFGELGNTLLISAQSAHTDTDWAIDIYGANAGYIGTFTGHTTNGVIYGSWDLVGPPPDYIAYTNEPWFQFEVRTPYADPPSPKTYRQTDPWIGPGDWVMAAQHAWDTVVGSDDLYAELDGYVTLARGSGLTVRPNPDTSGHAFALHVGLSSDPQPTSDWTALRGGALRPAFEKLHLHGTWRP